MLPSRLRDLPRGSVCLTRAFILFSYSSCWVSGRRREETDLDVAEAEERLLRAERQEGRGARKVPTQQPFDALNDCMHSFR